MEPSHHYNICYVSLNNDGSMRYMNRVVVAERKFINSPALTKFKENNNLPTQATLVSVSYLGFMTEKEWEGE